MLYQIFTYSNFFTMGVFCQAETGLVRERDGLLGDYVVIVCDSPQKY